jgi:hypothetical protein
MRSRSAALPALLALTACSGEAATDPAEGERVAKIEVFRNELDVVTTIQRDVRIEALEKRVAELERALGEVSAKPAMELDLISGRLRELESRAYAPLPPPAPATKAPAPADRNADRAVQKAMDAKRSTPR